MNTTEGNKLKLVNENFNGEVKESFFISWQRLEASLKKTGSLKFGEVIAGVSVDSEGIEITTGQNSSGVH
jgi:hypothetical protein